jgi:hypothetical protein
MPLFENERFIFFLFFSDKHHQTWDHNNVALLLAMKEVKLTVAILRKGSVAATRRHTTTCATQLPLRVMGLHHRISSVHTSTTPPKVMHFRPGLGPLSSL